MGVVVCHSLLWLLLYMQCQSQWARVWVPQLPTLAESVCMLPAHAQCGTV